MKTGTCPGCGANVEFEPCTFLPRVVPLCDACEAKQTARVAAEKREGAWKRLYRARLPEGYQFAKLGEIRPPFGAILGWNPETHPGGAGLIGEAGTGKSCALACLLWKRRTTFLWWSGTEARDAATEAATADKDREGAMRRWEAAMRVQILVLDDISQGRMTEAWSARLFDLLETRLAARLPTLWTSQIPLDRIRSKIARQNGHDEAQAAAISRRLGQHSLVIGQ